MALLQTYIKELIALVVPLIVWWLDYVFKAKAKLAFGNLHQFTFLVHEPLRNAAGQIINPTQTVHTRSCMVRNAGKETATKIEWVFNWKPPCVNFWPSRPFQEHVGEDGRYTMTFESLAPGEVLGCELLSVNVNLPDLIALRSDQCIAKPVQMNPQPVISVWVWRLRALLILLGIGLVTYWIVLLISKFW